MAIKAMNLDAVTKFISKEDDDKDPTIFHLGALSSREAGHIRDSVTSIKIKASEDGADTTEDDIETTIERAKMEFESVRLGVRKIENWQDGDGKVIEIKMVKRAGENRKTLPDSILDTIPLSIISELSARIMKSNEVTAEEAKN